MLLNTTIGLSGSGSGSVGGININKIGRTSIRLRRIVKLIQFSTYIRHFASNPTFPPLNLNLDSSHIALSESGFFSVCQRITGNIRP